MRIANSSSISDDGRIVVDTTDSSKYETASMKRQQSLDVDAQPHMQQLASTLSSSNRAPRVLPHECPEPECRRRFNRKYTLVEHMKTHTGEKPHVCPVQSCGKRFSTSGNLSRHKRLHGFIQPLACPVDGCASTFSNANKLEKHMKFHAGSPVHVCQIASCGKTFSTMGNLNRHIKNQHADAGAGCASLSALAVALDDVLPLANSQHAYQLDDLASILHEEIDFDLSVSSDDAPVAASLGSLSLRDARGTSDESENEGESPSRKRRRTILDDMIHFHVAHFGS